VGTGENRESSPPPHEINLENLEDPPDPRNVPQPPWSAERGMITYVAGLEQPMIGQPIRVGTLWHLPPTSFEEMEQVTLSLYINGFTITRSDNRPTLSVACSPFSLVQACRMHSPEADEALPWLRLFKISVFLTRSTHFFAVKGETAEVDRARWVADIARAVRDLTQSLFPTFKLSAHPVTAAPWTGTRILAGFLLRSDPDSVTVLYCELHTHWDQAAQFVCYEDERCDALVLRLRLTARTAIGERVGVDCSCFTVDGHAFTARTCEEKQLWLRAISNVKVKLRNSAPNPSSSDLLHYREAIADRAEKLPQRVGGDWSGGISLLPRLVRHDPEEKLMGCSWFSDVNEMEVAGERVDPHTVGQALDDPFGRAAQGHDDSAQGGTGGPGAMRVPHQVAAQHASHLAAQFGAQEGGASGTGEFPGEQAIAEPAAEPPLEIDMPLEFESLDVPDERLISLLDAAGSGAAFERSQPGLGGPLEGTNDNYSGVSAVSLRLARDAKRAAEAPQGPASILTGQRRPPNDSSAGTATPPTLEKLQEAATPRSVSDGLGVNGAPEGPSVSADDEETAAPSETATKESSQSSSPAALPAAYSMSAALPPPPPSDDSIGAQQP